MGLLSTLYGGTSTGGGGGGGETYVVTDPLKLNRFSVTTGDTYGKFGQNTTISSGNTSNSDFYTYNDYSDFFVWASTTSDDTYVTLLDTSNANGGYLFWIMGCGTNNTASSASTIKITVDGGTPVELSYIQTDVYYNYRPFLGGGLTTTSVPTTSSTFSTSLDPWNSYNFRGNGNLYTPPEEDFANGFMPLNRSVCQIVFDPCLLNSVQFQKLYFESSLKIEVKQSTYTATQLANRAACMYKLL